jgi:hypothetical protein
VTQPPRGEEGSSVLPSLDGREGMTGRVISTDYSNMMIHNSIFLNSIAICAQASLCVCMTFLPVALARIEHGHMKQKITIRAHGYNKKML